jgi:hypothetical protein
MIDKIIKKEIIMIKDFKDEIINNRIKKVKMIITGELMNLKKIMKQNNIEVEVDEKEVLEEEADMATMIIKKKVKKIIKRHGAIEVEEEADTVIMTIEKKAMKITKRHGEVEEAEVEEEGDFQKMIIMGNMNKMKKVKNLTKKKMNIICINTNLTMMYIVTEIKRMDSKSE